ncbi:hypothetical protein D6817_05405 [Candidatus Pacearchaeota archaeon]|nr:MAG: hypothetical protein D6817_05405 [Candidatus Pacearchaeota archaeon]
MVLRKLVLWLRIQFVRQVFALRAKRTLSRAPPGLRAFRNEGQGALNCPLRNLLKAHCVAAQNLSSINTQRFHLVSA